MKKVILLSGLVFAVISCDTATDKKVDNNVQVEDTIQVDSVENTTMNDSIDGTYVGILPCASCTGIETTVDLKEGNSYDMKSVYIDEEDSTFETNGIYEFDEEKNTITLKSDDKPIVFLIEENQLRMLDSDGNKVTGVLEENYILKRK